MATLTNWQFLVAGYLLTVAIEVPVLVVGLGRRHRLAVRLFAGLWLTACTYPIVILAMPALPDLWVEPFAAVAEILAFRALTGSGSLRDGVAIVAANLASYGLGRLLLG